MKFLKVGKQFKIQTSTYINEDLPAETRKKRKELKPLLLHFKSQGKKVSLRGEKLFVDGTLFKSDATDIQIEKH